PGPAVGAGGSPGRPANPSAPAAVAGVRTLLVRRRRHQSTRRCGGFRLADAGFGDFPPLRGPLRCRVRPACSDRVDCSADPGNHVVTPDPLPLGRFRVNLTALSEPVTTEVVL